MATVPGAGARTVVGLAVLAVGLPAVAAAQCGEQALSVFESEGYTIRRVLVQGPFVNARAMRDVLAASGVAADGPLRVSAVQSGRAELRKTLRDMPSLFESPVAGTVVETYGDACQADTKQLDIVYRVFTTKLALGLSRTLEGSQREAQDPAARLAMGKTPVRYRVSPIYRYNALERSVFGARLVVTPRRAFGQLDLGLEGSSAITNVDLDVSGGHSSDTAVLRTADWRIGYRNRDRLTDAQRFEDQRLATQVSASLRPIGSTGTVLRVATSLELGNHSSTVAAETLPTAYVPDAGYGSWKSAVGATVRGQHHAVSASYGLELGATRGADVFDYRKLVGEIDYQGRLVGTGGWRRRRPIDLAGRMGLGRLRGDDQIPAGARFFGGSSDPAFLAGDGWTIAASPVIRGFPASSLAGIEGGAAAGGDSFVSFNVTASMPVWAKPLVPAEVSSDQTVRQALAGQLDSGQNALATIYKMKDPAHATAVEAGLSLAAPLAAMQSRLEAILPTVPEPLEDMAQACTEQADTFSLSVDSLSNNTYAGALLRESVDEGDATLASVLRVCVDGLARPMNDLELLKAGAAMTSAKTALEGAIARIDVGKAERLAAGDLAFARKIVPAIFDELNAVAVGPVLVFDAARLAQRDRPTSALNRYSLGAGIRLSVASALHVSVGYVRNLNTRVGERHGAAFAAIELSTLFGE